MAQQAQRAPEPQINKDDKPATPADRLAELEAREKALAEREAALVQREAALAGQRKSRVQAVWKALIENPAISDAELAKVGGTTPLKEATLKAQRRLVAQFLSLAREMGRWKD